MNTSFAEEMLHALVSVSFEPVRESQEAMARQALRDKGLQVTVHWADGTQKTFYLVTAFDPSKTFVCFSSDSTMTGPLHQAWVSDIKKKITWDFTSALIPAWRSLALNPCETEGSYLWISPLSKFNRLKRCFTIHSVGLTMKAMF